MSDLKRVIDALRDDDQRWDAILELKLLSDPDLVARLVPYLKDKDWVVRWSVAEKLGDLHESDAITPLIDCLSDPDPHVRKNVAKALVKFGAVALPHIIPYFERGNPFIRRGLIAIVSSMGSAVVPALEQHMLSQSWAVSTAIAHLIWSIGGDEAEHALIRALAYPDIQKNAIVLLGSIGSITVIPQLLVLYEKPHLRRSIYKAILAMDQKKAFPIVVRYLNAPEPAQGASKALIRKFGQDMLPYLGKSLVQRDVPAKTLIILIDKIGAEPIMPALHRLAQKNDRIRKVTAPLRKKYPLQEGKPKKGFLGLFGA